MIYEYAVDPELCADWRDLRMLIDSFGKSEGRVMSDVPVNKWLGEAYLAIRASEGGTVKRKRLKLGARRLIEKALYRRETSPAAEGSWINTAKSYHADHEFRAIITHEYSGDEDYIVTNDIDLSHNPLWQVPHDLNIDRVANLMINEIKPFLEMAGEVILVDRNFDPREQRFVNVVIKILELLKAKSTGPPISKVVYHLGDKLGKGEVVNRCQQYVKGRIPSGMSLDLYIWPKDDLHDRFILTEVGGVKFSVGLDESLGGGTSKVIIDRLAEETYREWWAKCHQRCKQYEPDIAL